MQDMNVKKYRVGIGFDIHRFARGKNTRKKLVLGQVMFNFQGLEGASQDVDVLLHSISDAVLGAAGEPDIGTMFPPNKSKGISSREILAKVKKIVEEKGYRIENVDCVIVAQEPKIGDKIPKIKENVRKILGCDVNVRVKSPEGIGALGRGEGISVLSVALLKFNG